MATHSTTTALCSALQSLDPDGEDFAKRFVDELLAATQQVAVSDIHLQPTDAGLDVRWRIDGVLQAVGTFPIGDRTDPITRLKVLAKLLTYRQDIPQEGRLRESPHAVEMRVSTFPTLRGERAVIRLFNACLLYTSPSPRDATLSRMPSSA